MKQYCFKEKTKYKIWFNMPSFRKKQKNNTKIVLKSHQKKIKPSYFSFPLL